MSVVFYIICGLTFLAALLFWSHRRAMRKIAGWAHRNNFRVISARWTSKWASPFQPIPSHSIQQRETYRIKVQDSNGAIKEGWLSLLYEDDDVGFSAVHLNLPDEEVLWDEGSVP
jgi:hypothetical protein